MTGKSAGPGCDDRRVGRVFILPKTYIIVLLTSNLTVSYTKPLYCFDPRGSLMPHRVVKTLDLQITSNTSNYPYSDQCIALNLHSRLSWTPWSEIPARKDDSAPVIHGGLDT